jgi:hypothetical protein
MFGRKKKELADCTQECEEFERQECDECNNYRGCKNRYPNTAVRECWDCRYKDREKQKCLLRYKEDKV